MMRGDEFSRSGPDGRTEQIAPLRAKPPDRRAEGDRNIGVDVLRAVAILIVMALHWVNSRLPAPATSPWDDVFIRFAGHGTYGVELFFVLSGFLITRAAMTREANLFAMSARAFYVRRIARIQPLYLAIVAIGFIAILVGPLASGIFRYTFREPSAVFGGEFIASLLTFSYNWEMIAHRDAFAFRGLHWDVMWSLAVEEQFYLAFPLLILWARAKRRLTLALLAVVALGAATRVATDAAHAGLLVKLMNSFSCFDAIALGVLCALWIDRWKPSPLMSDGAVTIGAAAILMACYRGGIAALILGACLFVIGAGSTRIFRHRLWRIPARVGQLSYGLYLFQALALWLAAPLLEGRDVALAFAVFVGAAVLLAEASYRYYEGPLNVWTKAILNRRRAT
jgi:peptidoglycan/LPS O-acetylase OafA/YrhL